MNYRTAVIKRNLELAGMFPIVMLGKLVGKLFPLKTKHNIFLFFPNMDIGGAVKVNADIARCIKDAKPLIILSKKPKNEKFKSQFDIEGVRIIDLHKYIDNKLLHFINFFYRGVIASWVNAAKDPVIFGGESIYFYKIVPHVSGRTRIVELCHVNTWLNFTQAFVKYIDLRILSTPQIKRDHLEQYEQNGVPAQYRERVIFIDNKTDIPAYKPVDNSVLQVLYVGRGAPQKRVHLIGEIARQMHALSSNVHFSFVGDVETIIPADVQQYCTMYGSVTDKAKLDEYYLQSDVLILTSAFEGLPIVVMDMMARGKIVLSTAVSGIPDYITHKETGMLLYEKEESKIVAEAIVNLNLLAGDRDLRERISKNSYEFASAHFGEEKFNRSYRNILLNGGTGS